MGGVIPAFNFENYTGTKNVEYKFKCISCDFEFSGTLDNGHTPLCPKCHPNRLTINLGHPDTIVKKCEECNKYFLVIWKNRNQRFCSVSCKRTFISKSVRETVNCLNCGKPFVRRKKADSGRENPRQYCSNHCSVISLENRNKRREWGLSGNNHWRKSECQAKVSETKLKRYGNKKYNNTDRQLKTIKDRYGVYCSFDLPQSKSGGHRVSKFQKITYERILKDNPDALLEEYLSDVERSVDIYIPSKKHIVECNGDYWHCNPKIYGPDYYNKLVHLTAQEIWDKDEEKYRQLRSNGYSVDIVWENSRNH
jgi:endogenous inhibitor of DNA gyrase (YacG/DUF329 family)